MGYASLFSLQGKLKALYRIDPSNLSDENQLFTSAVSMLYIGNLCFRLLHNVFFGFLAPRNRVVLSVSSMTLSMGTLFALFLIYGLILPPDHAPPHLAFVFIAYGLGGTNSRCGVL
jgi:hypothetical protein